MTRKALAALALLLPLGACSWFTDFKQTPVVYPWETANDSVPPRGNPQFSVPVQGSMAPALAVSYSALPDSFDALANPVPADVRSLENGRKLYQINCAVCHGANGTAGASAPVTKYGLYAPPINGPATQGRSDGYLWGIIRNGRAGMPPYTRIEELERWDVVNYVRALQGRVAGAQVAAAPAGLPGEGGTALPGYSELGPTRPAPYFNHIGMQAGAAQRRARGTTASVPPAGGQPGVADSLARGAAGADSAARPRPDTTTPRGQQP